MDKINVIGRMDNTIDGTFESANRIYDKHGLCPTIPTRGNDQVPKILQETNLGGVVSLDRIGGTIRGGGENNEHQLELRVDGLANTITSAQKDSIVIEQRLVENGLNAELKDFVWEINGDYVLIEPRKLTARESWRLMGFTDEQYDKAAEVNSRTQLYKQAGNSIVKDVLKYLFMEMI